MVKNTLGINLFGSADGDSGNPDVRLVIKRDPESQVQIMGSDRHVPAAFSIVGYLRRIVYYAAQSG